MPDQPDRDLGEFVEDFASTLVASGVPRMPARVFACLLVSPSGRLTSAELAERLQVSPAAISGAVQYLQTVELLRRTREPGSRREQYVIDHDVWYRAIMNRDQLLVRWISHLDKGIGLAGPDSPVGERLAETKDFFAFLLAEMSELQARWEARRRTPSDPA